MCVQRLMKRWWLCCVNMSHQDGNRSREGQCDASWHQEVVYNNKRVNRSILFRFDCGACHARRRIPTCYTTINERTAASLQLAGASELDRLQSCQFVGWTWRAEEGGRQCVLQGACFVIFPLGGAPRGREECNHSWMVVLLLRWNNGFVLLRSLGKRRAKTGRWNMFIWE